MQIKFVLREAFKGLGRNLTMTIALVITTAISVALVVAGVLVSNMARETQDIYLERVEVMIQLDEEISTSDNDCSSDGCREVREILEADDGVESVTYRSREESYQRFVEVFQDTDPVLVEETSPDALPAALHVRLVNPTDTEPIDAVRDLPQVDTIVDQVEEVRSATDNLNSIRNATFLLAFVQAIAAIFLIANMVQIAAFNRSTEIGIMRMVGASRWITQAPFVLEAVLASVIGVILAGLGVFAAKSTIIDSALASLYQSQLLAPIQTADIWVSWPLVGIAAILAAAVTAAITLRVYVRK
ncbi:permease-like cell division protein FtsX [Corynebacterium ammoniagenes]|uniref:Cell division protein FtsX n=2 Tax=Corynebacterium ammoniagenes TaxID=1697 RepID=A0AAV5G9L3_CORAM|nr:permease-like cell division protein FtsX [Corynebacterium ammoniagenes]APT83183.1 cell division protein FtsX [Corynebacterium ammoniagenes DSM 20306]AQS74211.1 ABC transporter permease [Corynebacterium ammoniagenes]EFG81585.1 efflux ABC transporter, permease protein [Corynebacterium ammoniagenes DSM 20306]GJN43477.1 cell division protein FtsX [Corynebacterium ammoniagenes]